MTQDAFNKLFKSGDAGATFAAVEQHIEGALGALGAKHAETLSERDKQIEELTGALQNAARERDQFEAQVKELTRPAVLPVTGSTLGL